MDVCNLTNEPGLILQVSQGDERAFAALFYAYQPLLFNYVYKITKSEMLAEEIVQDVFLKIWISRESLLHITNFKNYIFIVSRNHTINFIKKLAAEHRKELLLKNYIAQSTETGDPGLHYGTIIDEAINRLPPQQQRVYLLSRHEGLKYTEIAAIMGIGPRTVKSYMKLAIESIKVFVKNKTIQMILTFAFGQVFRLFFK